jgi:hypothetical protein
LAAAALLALAAALAAGQETVTAGGAEREAFCGLSIQLAGEPKSFVRGSFRGTLFDEEGVLHAISDGVFSAARGLTD